MKKRNIINFTLTIFMMAFIVLPINALAQNVTVTQGYTSDILLQRGMVVGLNKDDPRKVEAINNTDEDRVHGIVVNSSESAVLLGREEDKVFVATSGGPFPTLVSSQNGAIKKGEYVALSSISGIGMRAGESEPIILGKATEDFNPDDKDKIISTATVTDSNKNQQSLVIGLVNVDISIGKNPLLKSNNDLPDALRRASEAIAGKPVSPARVYLSVLVLLISAGITGSLIYSAVRSSVIAIGRNPLSKKSIIRGLFQVVIIGILVFLSGIFGVYLILNL
jgi:hypothetical protein